MSGVPKIEIAESAETLQKLMKQQKTGLNFAKVQALYLIQIQMVETVRSLATIVGRNEATVHRWLRLYREGGLEALLEEKKSSGRPPKLSEETMAQIRQELENLKEFSSYKEVQDWLENNYQIQIPYKTLYHILRKNEWNIEIRNRRSW